jgi:hypothetical protein
LDVPEAVRENAASDIYQTSLPSSGEQADVDAPEEDVEADF